jgi:hypothetical protein
MKTELRVNRRESGRAIFAEISREIDTGPGKIADAEGTE